MMQLIICVLAFTKDLIFKPEKNCKERMNPRYTLEVQRSYNFVPFLSVTAVSVGILEVLEEELRFLRHFRYKVKEKRLQMEREIAARLLCLI